MLLSALFSLWLWTGPIQVERTEDCVLTLHGSGEPQTYAFDLSIHNIGAHPTLPLVWVTTLDWDSYEVFEGFVTPTHFLPCKAYFINASRGTITQIGGGCTTFATEMWSPNGRYAFIQGGIYATKELLDFADPREATPLADIHELREGCYSVWDLSSLEWHDNDHFSVTAGECGCSFAMIVNVTQPGFALYALDKDRCPKYYLDREAFEEATARLKR
ncbi:hypothetical protein [Acanthopleuribacter pedis]|uniref:Uncharacterized protein n=1 Tax=Acanthopleuribacter pedis TaxID=442870 RepID=A0A8J7Q9H1_9BACT|nr:hypothetical protein [Acanthopleuribacter pedis]MBO1320370.1 hypothetical protein [Acanthopleuribacter pedis]